MQPNTPFALAVDQSDTTIAEFDENTLLNGLANFQTGKIQFTPDQLLLPRIRLCQGLTTEVQSGDAKPGQWLIPGESPKERITVVPLAMGIRRRLSDSNRIVMCQSPDGKSGTGSPGGVCAQCIYSRWTQSGNTRIPPECTESYEYLSWVVGTNTVALLTFQKTTLRAARILNTHIAGRGFGNFAVELGSTKQITPKGTFFVPTITLVAISDTTRQEIAKFLKGG